MNHLFHNRRLDRRTLLRAAGVALALPWLDAMQPARGRVPPPPRRALFVFKPNGTVMDDWRPRAGADGAVALPFLLQPLQPLWDRVTVLSGLELDGGRAHGDGAGDHARAAASFLTCAHPRKTGGADLLAGVSVDQVLAQASAGATPFASLELGLERGAAAGICDSGYSCAYSNNISWRTPSTPVAKETDPRAVFARLFGDPTAATDGVERRRRAAAQDSVLDAVLAEAAALRRELGAADRGKLDDYLTAVRELEQRVQREAAGDADAVVSSESTAAVLASGDALPARLDAMYELLALAFATDRTRVATLMLGNAGSNRSYRFLGVPQGHHDQSHHGGDPQKLAAIRAIDRFHVERFAAFLQRLRGIAAGDGDLLSASHVLFASGLADGDRHNHDDLPVLLAGGRGGRHLELRPTPMANLYVGILRAMGVASAAFGDSTGAIEV